jgi:DNA-binding MarR family transcriptional regulator
MTRDSEKRCELIAAIPQEFRQLATATILFHQAVADRLGMHLTDHKCGDILVETGPITAGELAERTGLTTGAITGVIDRLEKTGFVRRAKDPDDRRRVIIEPLPERIKGQIAPLFQSIGHAIAGMCARYSTRELAAIRDFITSFNQLTYEEATKLRDGGVRAKPDKSSRPTASE